MLLECCFVILCLLLFPRLLGQPVLCSVENRLAAPPTNAENAKQSKAKKKKKVPRLKQLL